MQGATSGAPCGTSNVTAGGVSDLGFKHCINGCCEAAAYFELAHGIAQTAKKLEGGRENKTLKCCR